MTPAERQGMWFGLLGVMTFAVTLPMAWLSQPTAPVPWKAWGGFAYVCVFSMWLGFRQSA